MDEYLLQDSRSYVGNDILFWREGGGYTTNVDEAEVFTKERAVRLNKARDTDIPWPKTYILTKVRPAVDMQYADINEALLGTGIELHKEKPYKKPQQRCWHCGVFITEHQQYTSCPKCGESNAP